MNACLRCGNSTLHVRFKQSIASHYAAYYTDDDRVLEEKNVRYLIFYILEET